ncbi:MAG: alpha/beta hydrolase [Alphaproteobacteria bacterium]
MSYFFRVPSFKSTLIIFLTIYVFLLILIYIFQRSLQYFPSGSADLPNGFEEVKLKTEDGIEVMVWQKIPENYKKIIVYFHGNAGNIGDRTYRLETFSQKGYGVVALSYRGYFGSQGSPSQNGLINDAKAVMRYLNSKNIAKNDLILFGESLGTGVVAQIGANYLSDKTFKPLINLEVSSPQVDDDQDIQKNSKNLADNSLVNPDNSKPENSQGNKLNQVSENNASKSAENNVTGSVASKSAGPIIVDKTSVDTTSAQIATESSADKSIDQYFMIVLESPFFNIEELAKKTYPILPVKLMLQDRYDSNLFVPNIKSPVLVFHGDKDRVVPIESGRKLFLLITARKKFVELRGSYHVDTNPDFLIEQIENFSGK